MKKFVLLLMALIGTLKVQADSFSYLTFETTDGEKASIAVDESQDLSISGTTLTVGSQSFTLTNLSKMYFTETDETATGIESIQKSNFSQNEIEDDAEVYDLKGNKIVNGKLSNGKLTHGVYIIKTTDKTYKLIIK
ncbi:MAG: hypothetical protein IKP36_03940 [Bacteroidaceae bacterium]|nr:hypothetical protein [Bacteroidaceae bacterium]